MNLPNYKVISEHYKDCFDKHGDTHLGVDWPNHEDTIIRHQVMLDITNNKNKDKISILDFGCGSGHFLEFINDNNIIYYGLDINKNYIDHCKNKFSKLKDNFILGDIHENINIVPNVDYIIINGMFNEKRQLTNKEMMKFVKETLIKLWDKCETGIAFNFMSKFVDWERDDLFYVSLDELGWFLKNNLSRNFIIRNDYGLYEYTTYVYK